MGSKGPPSPGVALGRGRRPLYDLLGLTHCYLLACGCCPPFGGDQTPSQEASTHGSSNGIAQGQQRPVRSSVSWGIIASRLRSDDTELLGTRIRGHVPPLGHFLATVVKCEMVLGVSCGVRYAFLCEPSWAQGGGGGAAFGGSIGTALEGVCVCVGG